MEVKDNTDTEFYHLPTVKVFDICKLEKVALDGSQPQWCDLEL